MKSGYQNRMIKSIEPVNGNVHKVVIANKEGKVHDVLKLEVPKNKEAESYICGLLGYEIRKVKKQNAGLNSQEDN